MPANIISETTMSISEALGAIKMLDKRIKSKTEAATFCSYSLAPGDKKLQASASSELQSILDLIARRSRIKAAIVQSNATTKLEIAGVEYSVASAIELKKSISYRRELLTTIMRQYANADREVKRRHDATMSNLNNIIATSGAVDKEVIDALSTAYIAQNAYQITGLENVTDLIKNMSDELDAFDLSVDFRLSESNAITRITVRD